MRTPEAARVLHLLAFLSGMCGLAYELLYARLLSTFLGDMFYVSASILVCFLLGMASGARFAHRFSAHLWLIEALIGLYAVALASTTSMFSAELLAGVHPLTGGQPAIVLGLVLAVLLIPSVLIGFGIPLFARTLRHHESSDGSATPFDRIYGLYNLGAGACVLLIEYLLLRHLGIRSSLYAIALINLVIAVILRVKIAPPPAAPASAESPLPASARRTVVALFVVSALSGVYQLWLLKLTGIVFGPYHENFALVVALGLFGITSGTWLAHRTGASLHSWLRYGGLLFAGAMLLVTPLIFGWAWVGAPLVALGMPAPLMKGGALLLMSVVPLSVFGGTIPALLGEHPVSDRTEGHLLWVSGLGNCLGYVLMVLVLYQLLPYGALAALLVLGLGIAAVIASPRGLPGAGTVVVASLAGLLLWAWPEALMSASYRTFQSAGALDALVEQMSDYETFRRYDSQVSLVHRHDGTEELVIDGYRSLRTADYETQATEILFGITPSLFSGKTENALVLGIGKGITAGANAEVYDRTVTVDVNPVILELQPRFASENFSIATRDDVELVLDDGISYLAQSEERFDAIVNTVTSPLFFASSKLYTTDFNALVRARLADDGIYAFWFDSRVTEAGARIVFDTVRASFDHCVFVYMKSAYTQLLCSPSPIQLRRDPSAPWSPALVAAVEPHGLTPLSDALDALVFPKHRLHEESWGTAGNTFDLPALEFTMASAALVTDGPAWSPFELAGVDVSVSASGTTRDLDQKGRRCHYLGCASELPPWCMPLLTQNHTAPPPRSFLELQLEQQRRRPTAEWPGLAGQLLRHNDLEATHAELEAMSSHVGEQMGYLQLRAMVTLARDGDVPDSLLDRLHQAAPTSSEVRRLMARVAAARGRVADALAQLALVREQQEFTGEDAALERALRSKPR